MKIRVLAFYTMSALSLSLFVALPAAESNPLNRVQPEISIAQILIESVDRFFSARY